jgi:hypothetical protein
MFERLNFDENFWNFIEDTKKLCKISNILNHDNGSFLKKEGDFIKVVNGEFDTVSFIPKSKLQESSGFNEEKYRTKIKIGRFIKKFFKKEVFNIYSIYDIDIEIFVNLFKSYFDNDIKKFKIISGSEIKKWYLEDNYFFPNGYRCGTIWNSCMRYSEKNSYMDIYAENPNVVKMLVHIDEVSGKVKSRALLWENVTDVDGNSYKIMDRIYTYYDHEVTSFKKWASENGYIFKYEQSAKSEILFKTPNGVKDLRLKIQLENWKMINYPYIDTFKFLDFNKGMLYNSDYFNFDFILIQNDGALERYEEDLAEEPEDGW